MAFEYYQSVHVAIIDWDNNDPNPKLQLDPRINTLEKTFRNVFNFRVERIHIDSSDPQSSLQRRVERFYVNIAKVKPEGRALVIVFYTGHGGFEDSKNWGTRCLWARTSLGPVVNWLEVERNCVTKFNYDQLLLVDCCYAGNAVPAHVFGDTMDQAVDNSERAVSLRAIMASDHIHKSYGSLSFTVKLNETLNQLSSYAFTIDELAERIPGVLRTDQLPQEEEEKKKVQAVYYPVRRAKTPQNDYRIYKMK